MHPLYCDCARCRGDDVEDRDTEEEEDGDEAAYEAECERRYDAWKDEGRVGPIPRAPRRGR